jgi:hypothetical protein
MNDDRHMIELRLRSGEIVTFDGRVLEIFRRDGPSERVHVAQVEAAVAAEPDGASSVRLGGTAELRFAPEEAPARARLMAAVEETRRTYG